MREFLRQPLVQCSAVGLASAMAIGVFGNLWVTVLGALTILFELVLLMQRSGFREHWLVRGVEVGVMMAAVAAGVLLVFYFGPIMWSARGVLLLIVQGILFLNLILRVFHAIGVIRIPDLYNG